MGQSLSVCRGVSVRWWRQSCGWQRARQWLSRGGGWRYIGVPVESLFVGVSVCGGCGAQMEFVGKVGWLGGVGVTLEAAASVTWGWDGSCVWGMRYRSTCPCRDNVYASCWVWFVRHEPRRRTGNKLEYTNTEIEAFCLQTHAFLIKIDLQTKNADSASPRGRNLTVGLVAKPNRGKTLSRNGHKTNGTAASNHNYQPHRPSVAPVSYPLHSPLNPPTPPHLRAHAYPHEQRLRRLLHTDTPTYASHRCHSTTTVSN